MVTVQDFIEFLRPDDTSEDLSGYLAAALSKARTAGIPSFKHNAQFDLFIKSLAVMYYENRNMEPDNPKSAEAIQRMINSYVFELRYAEEDPEEGF